MQRRVSVYKTVKKDNTEVSQNLINLTFSDGAKQVLQDLFICYPPDDEDSKKISRKISEHRYNLLRKRDPIFCKPLMSKAEIAKKVEALASSMQDVPNLRKVFYLPTHHLRPWFF